MAVAKNAINFIGNHFIDTSNNFCFDYHHWSQFNNIIESQSWITPIYNFDLFHQHRSIGASSKSVLVIIDDHLTNLERERSSHSSIGISSMKIKELLDIFKGFRGIRDYLSLDRTLEERVNEIYNLPEVMLLVGYRLFHYCSDTTREYVVMSKTK